MKRYAYYPGCSLKGAGKPYEMSLLALFKKLGAELWEIDDWNCCGATAYMSINERSATLLALRNLALAEKAGYEEVLTPCVGCYVALKKAIYYYQNYPDMRQRISDALSGQGLTYRGVAHPVHPLEAIERDYGFDEIKKLVENPLKGLKVAPYYGCALRRPFGFYEGSITSQALEKVIEVSGATPIEPFGARMRCCGGMQTVTSPDVGYGLVYAILKDAKDRDADILLTGCPLCHYNLEVLQEPAVKKFSKESFNLPILYFTQLLGLALGLSEKELGLDMLIYKPVLEVAVK